MTPVVWHAPALNQPEGRQVVMPWEVIEHRVHTPKAERAKESLARWALVEFASGYRSLANFRRAHAVVLDIDDGTPLSQLEAAFDGDYAILHSTFSASEIKPRSRVVVPLDRPVETTEQFDRVWRAQASKIEAVGGVPDYGARDASRCWAVPARPPSGHYIARTLRGAFVSVDKALAIIPKPEPLPAHDPSGNESEPYDRRMMRASRYLAKMPAAISGSHGHGQTFKVATALVRGFSIPPDDALQMLMSEYNPRCWPPWSEFELRHKVKQAYQRARMPFGALAQRRRSP